MLPRPPCVALPRTTGLPRRTRCAADETAAVLSSAILFQPACCACPAPQYIVVDTLGRGSFGKVKLCLNTGNDMLCAVKVVSTKLVSAACAGPGWGRG